MDSAKQRLSREYSNNILFVEAPSESLIQNIENGKSKLCETNLNSEHTLLARHDIKSDVRHKIERLMREHSRMCEREDDCEAEVECEQSVYSNLRPEIRELGSSLVSYVPFIQMREGKITGVVISLLLSSMSGRSER